MKRVVITGQGAVSAIGMSAAEVMASMREGVSGIGETSFEDHDRLSIRIGGQIKGYDPEAYFGRQEIALYDPFTQFLRRQSHKATSPKPSTAPVVGSGIAVCEN